LATPDQPRISLSTSPRVIIERVRQHRDFPLQLLIVLRDDMLVQQQEGFTGVLKVARSLAKRLDITVLFAEGPLGPSEWIRVRASGQTDVVSLDIDETGEIDSFFVIAERALSEGHETGQPGQSRLSA
jgi:hypothetical protein